MSHDAEKLDKAFFLLLDYQNCLRYIQVYHQLIRGPHTQYFDFEKDFRTGHLSPEVCDKVKALVARGYLGRRTYASDRTEFCLTPKGWDLLRG